MTNNNFDRRRFLGVAAGALAAPVVWRSSPASAAEVEKMAGQLLVIGFPGSSTASGSTRALARHIAAGRAGGALFLRHNVKSGAETKAMARQFLNAHAGTLTAIDQEGGKVQRLGSKHGLAAIPTAQWVGGNKSVAEARAIYSRAGKELKAAGFNMNMAPSVDIHDSKNPVIGRYGRSFSTDVDRIASYAGAFVDGFAVAGVACSIKHFPGHGSSRSDSHDGFVNISKTWNKKELVPFQKLAGRAPMIMGGHLFHPLFSNGKAPVTFSSNALVKSLRNGLGYKGVILTDDLDMGAIRKSYQLKEAVILALAAGNDMLLLSNSLKYDEDLPARAVGWIAEAVQQNRISSGQLQSAYRRVMTVKKHFGA